VKRESGPGHGGTLRVGEIGTLRGFAATHAACYASIFKTNRRELAMVDIRNVTNKPTVVFSFRTLGGDARKVFHWVDVNARGKVYSGPQNSDQAIS